MVLNVFLCGTDRVKNNNKNISCCHDQTSLPSQEWTLLCYNVVTYYSIDHTTIVIFILFVFLFVAHFTIHKVRIFIVLQYIIRIIQKL